MRRPTPFPTQFVAEELQHDEDAEREASIRELRELAEAFRRIGIAFALLVLATFVAIAVGRFAGICA